MFPRPLAFLDVETTGLSPAAGARVCEIAILRVDAYGEHPWETLVHPGIPIPPEVSAIHGITDDMVSTAPSFGRIADKVLGLIDDAVIVCHNVPFDLSFLAAEFAACQQCLPRRPTIDTLSVARRHFSFSSNALSAIARQLRIATPNAHRALADVTTTYAVFRHFHTVVNMAQFLPADDTQ